MQTSFVAIPLPLHQFTQLVRFLDAKKSPRDPISVIAEAVDYWMENADWKPADLLGIPDQPSGPGYWWKNLFLPEGTKLRMSYKGKMFDAQVVDNEIPYNGRCVSPSEFTFEVTNTSRNAWRDIEVLLPGKSQWESADRLRQQ
jgi:hypothetical protein